MGIEPTWSAWKAEVLPLNYIRIDKTYLIIPKINKKSTIFVNFFLIYLQYGGSNAIIPLYGG